MSTVGFHHTGLVVPDLARAEQFYCEVFDFEVVGRFDVDTEENEQIALATGLQDAIGRAAQLKGPNGFLELFAFSQPRLELPETPPQPNQMGFAHLAIQVTEIALMIDRLIQAGGSSPCRLSQIGKALVIYCRDPFGNIIELLEFVEDRAHFDLIAQKLI